MLAIVCLSVIKMKIKVFIKSGIYGSHFEMFTASCFTCQKVFNFIMKAIGSKGHKITDITFVTTILDTNLVTLKSWKRPLGQTGQR